MFLFKKIFLGLGLLTLFYMGGSGTQSNSLFMQGLGFAGLIIGLIVFYIFGRMVWRSLGCLPSFLILAAVVLFMMNTLGMFNNGLGGVGEAIIKFIGHEPQEAAGMGEENTDESVEIGAAKLMLSENFSDRPRIKSEASSQTDSQLSEQPGADLFGNPAPAPQGPKADSQPAQGLLGSIASAMSGVKEQKAAPKPFNPNDYPVLYGSARVISGDTLEIYGKYFKLFGLDAPEPGQMCADARGASYNCGRESAMWLKNWIGDNELECHVVQQDTKGNMIGTCSYGPYDLGAALVNAGWAVSYNKYTDIYQPYEIQAQNNRRGLWRGTFYKPWDWRKLQQRKPKIKVLKPKERKKGLFG